MAKKPNRTELPDDDQTRRSLNVLADATAEVVGRGDVYDAIVKVAEDGSESDFEHAKEKFDDMDIGDRVRIRAQAFETLGEADGEEPADAPPELDWANQMMANFPTLSDGLDGDK